MKRGKVRKAAICVPVFLSATARGPNMKKVWMLSLVLAGFYLGAAKGSTVVYVSKIGSDRFPYSSPSTAARTISAAVEAAQPGDIIDVAAGEYVEEVNLKEGIILWGWGADRTAVRIPEAAAYAIKGAASAEIRDLAILGGRRPDDPWDCWTVGLELPPGAGLIVRGCAVRGWFRYGVRADGPGVGQPCVLRRTAVQGCHSGLAFQGPGLYVVDSCSVRDCEWSGAILSKGASCVLAWSALDGNRYSQISCQNISNLDIVGCRVRGGWSGVWAEDAPISMVNCLVWGTENGVAMGFGSQVDLVHCTVTQCQRAFYAAEENEVTISYSIVWGNAEDSSEWLPSGLISEALASDIQTGANPDKWNIDADPLFRDAQNGDFHLTAASPCIDVGCGSDCYTGKAAFIEVDLDGRPRHLYGGRGYWCDPDMGAYEYCISEVRPGPNPDQSTFTWSSLSDKTYSIFYSHDLLTWHLAIANSPSSGNTTTSWIDDGSLTGLPPSLVPRRFYRIVENP
jgi:hypothetical protein